ncbi:MAG: DNA mismatch endonuclease Vsr [Kiritimatiellae bacterium]|nr:DNA mismatch endonuclease Vsr [Kiritimatiellia bacterium]
MDILSKEHRSWNMSRIRSRDTVPEKKVRSLLHRLGFRFRLHKTDLPGIPDIVLPKHRAVILIHGCFWHRHPRCKFAYTPKTRRSFWQKKFLENIERDKRNLRCLRRLGYRVLVIWECQIDDIDALENRLQRFLSVWLKWIKLARQ